MKFTSAFFWDLYARCYDGLLESIPYKRLLDRVVSSVPSNARSLLDAGCGTGNLLRVLEQKNSGLALEGFDYSTAMLARARSKLRGTRLTCGDLNQTLPYPSDAFDIVTCVNAIYAVPDLPATLQELLRVLKSGGTLILTSPLTKPRIRPFILEHAAEVGWLSTIPLLGRSAALLLLNSVIVRGTNPLKCHFLALPAVQNLFRNTPVSLAYSDQNWFVCFTK
jgi:ubiquinone/menaquinone biosynthesis C-methylase UbiE